MSDFFFDIACFIWRIDSQIFKVWQVKSQFVCEWAVVRGRKNLGLNWTIFVSPYQHFWFAAFFLKGKIKLINGKQNCVYFTAALLFETSVNEVTYIFIKAIFLPSQMCILNSHSRSRENSSSWMTPLVPNATFWWFFCNKQFI